MNKPSKLSMSRSWRRWCTTCVRLNRRGRQFVRSAALASLRFCRLAGSGRKCAVFLLLTYPHILFRLCQILISSPKKRKAIQSLYVRRLLRCRRCPLFHKELMTCGNAQSQETWWNHDKPEPMGCLCWMPAKALLPGNQCFLSTRLPEGTHPGWRTSEIGTASEIQSGGSTQASTRTAAGPQEEEEQEQGSDD